MNPLMLAGLGLGGVSDLFKTIYGFTQMFGSGKKYNDKVDALPKYAVDPNITYNKNLAGQIASQGIPDSAKNYYGDSIDRGLGSNINATLQGGGNLGQINNAYGTSTDAFRNLMAMDAQQKLANQQVLMGANKDLRDENLRAWDYNVNMPAQLKLGHYNDMRNAGAQNIAGGLKGIGSSFVGASQFDQYMNSINGGTGQKLGGGVQNNTGLYNMPPSPFYNPTSNPTTNTNGTNQPDWNQFYQLFSQLFANR